jgi:hypothetical protein
MHAIQKPGSLDCDCSKLIGRVLSGYGKEILDVQACVSETCFMLFLRFSLYQS